MMRTSFKADSLIRGREGNRLFHGAVYFAFAGLALAELLPFFVDVHVRIARPRKRCCWIPSRSPTEWDDRKLCHSVEGGYFLILS